MEDSLEFLDACCSTAHETKNTVEASLLNIIILSFIYLIIYLSIEFVNCLNAIFHSQTQRTR